MDYTNLLKQAEEAAKNAYAPYSNFHVGSAVLTEKGVFVGANVENAATNLGICAERVALSQARIQGARKIEVIAVFCADAKKDEAGEYILSETMPCGGCRQWMLELAPDAVVVSNGLSEPISVRELLPHGFISDLSG